MKGPIDYIIVGFEGNKFDGQILKAIEEASNQGIINVLALALVSKNDAGDVTTIDAINLGDEYLIEFEQSTKANKDIVTKEDIDEVGDLLENNTTAGLLVIEQVWAKPLKQAIINANGVLIAEGRIHPDANEELNEKGE